MILLVLCIIGAVSGLFLPETLHQKLPDSMQEARKFGANQVFILLPIFTIFRLSRLILSICSLLFAEILESSETGQKRGGKSQYQYRWIAETKSNAVNKRQLTHTHTFHGTMVKHTDTRSARAELDSTYNHHEFQKAARINWKFRFYLS